MAPPKNNQFWKKRSKHGRDAIFSSAQILEGESCKYFDWVDKNPRYRTEQKKGSVILPKDFDGNLAKVDGATVNMPVMRPYSMAGLCIFLGVSKNYFREFKKRASDDFLEVIEWIEMVIYTQKFEGAASGLLNANIISRELGLIDKMGLDHTTKGKELKVPKITLIPASSLTQEQIDQYLNRNAGNSDTAD